MKNNNRLYVFFLAVIGIGIGASLVGMEQHEEPVSRYADFAKNVAIGSAAGIAEVVVDQPLICIKNMLQQGKGITMNPEILYRGFGVNVACMGPATAAQIGINESLKSMLPGDDLSTAMAHAIAAGGLSVVVSSPIEMVVIHQQNTGKNARQVCEGLICQAGPLVLTRGMLAQSGRDAIFGGGFLAAYPFVKKKIRKHVKDNELVAMTGGALIAGGGTAIVSHPWDTVATFMKADYKKQKAKNTWQAIKYLYKNGGWKVFSKGVVPRGTRVGLAIPIMSKVDEYLRTWINKKSRKQAPKEVS